MDKFNYEDLQTLAYALPEDVQRRKDAGYDTQAISLIDKWLARDINEGLRKRLCLEKAILKRLPLDFPDDFAASYAKVKAVLPDMTVDRFRELQDAGRIDWIYVNGEERFFGRAAETLLDDPVNERHSAFLLEKIASEDASLPVREDTRLLRESVREMQESGEPLAYRFRIRTSFKIADAAFRPGHVRVWLPVPRASEQISGIRILATSDENYVLAPEDAHQRTILFDPVLKENREFFVEYEWVTTARYCNLWGMDTAALKDGQALLPVYPENSPAPSESDLAEKLPHIQFTPYLRALTEELTKGVDDPLEQARAFYDYITTKVKYSYMRSYFTVTQLPEYAAVNHKGDCGIQALLFITLCRIAGIPARWQSALQTIYDTAGCHDWAQFYIDGLGWLFCDPSYGGGAHDAGDEKRRRFYFGNLDPFRMVANDDVQEQFTPAPHFLRDDPYDNQEGEAEYDDEKISDVITERRITLKERIR
jgi:transglutaminase-like putative cysteine protease